MQRECVKCYIRPEKKMSAKYVYYTDAYYTCVRNIYEMMYANTIYTNICEITCTVYKECKACATYATYKA
jgi:hypothetical protein